MSKTIEFVDELIKDYKESKNNFTRYSKTYPNDEVFSICIKKREQQIQTLEQIKCELEAWEIIKREILITDGGVIHLAIEDDNIDYETIKKALEVKNEDNI